MKNKKSYHQQLQYANILMVSVVSVCILLFNLINTQTLKQYTKSVSCLNDLSEFYKEVELYTQYVKEYLALDDEKDLANSNKTNGKIEKILQRLNINAIDDEQWHFKALDNMYTSFFETSAKLIIDYAASHEGYEIFYDDFLRQSDLIQNTSEQYYPLITQVINEQITMLENIRKMIVLSSLLVFCLLLFWLVYYSNKVSYSFTQPLKLLLKNINKIKEGKYDLSKLSDAGEEMEGLCNALADMAKVVQTNIETTKEKAELEKKLLLSENEILKKDEILIQSELKSLQHQINPHFLFNTLNMIYRMTLQEGAEDAANMLVKTSQLLRYALDNQKRISSLEKEIEMIQKYIEIQHRRLGNRVNFILDYDREHIPHMNMPGMILQPLVENALLHGLHDVIKDGEIIISIKSQIDTVIIGVIDNGKGMKASRLEEFILNDYQKQDENQLGLYNVIRRLEMYFRNTISSNIYSDEDCGFEIYFEIKKLKKGEFHGTKIADSGR